MLVIQSRLKVKEMPKDKALSLRVHYCRKVRVLPMSATILLNDFGNAFVQVLEYCHVALYPHNLSSKVIVLPSSLAILVVAK